MGDRGGVEGWGGGRDQITIVTPRGAYLREDVGQCRGVDYYSNSEGCLPQGRCRTV